jgi:hypothetical protein
MGQAIQRIEDGEEPGASRKTGSGRARILPSLAVAIACTVLIAEAIVTVIHGRENGDLMVIVCPILGATFLSIPTVRAWWNVFSAIRAH